MRIGQQNGACSDTSPRCNIFFIRPFFILDHNNLNNNNWIKYSIIKFKCNGYQVFIFELNVSKNYIHFKRTMKFTEIYGNLLVFYGEYVEILNKWQFPRNLVRNQKNFKCYIQNAI